MSKRKPPSRAKTRTRRLNALRPRDLAFVAFYTGSCRGNGTQAAIAAGVPRAGAHVWASQALKNLKIQQAIKARVLPKLANEIATAAQIDKRLTEIMMTGDEHASIRAAHELNKCSGRHSISVKVDGRLTLEQAITQGRSRA